MSSTKNKDKNKIIKFLLLSLLLILSYVISVIVNGFGVTNLRFLYLLIFIFAGFLAFYLIYFIIYFITKIKYKIQENTKKNAVINCDDKVNDFLKNDKYKFVYDTKFSVKENFNSAFELSKSVISSVATICGKNNEYFYLNYTIYDAIEIYGNLVAFAYEKIDGVFKTFKIQDKPISFIEKTLHKVIEDEKPVDNVVKDNVLSKIKKGVGNAVVNTGIFLFKNKIQNAINEIISLICLEAFKVYSKGLKEPIKVLEQEVEVQNAW